MTPTAQQILIERGVITVDASGVVRLTCAAWRRLAMPDHYPPADEVADALLPFRWQVTTICEARSVVTQWHGQPDTFLLHEAAAQALFKRRGTRTK